jgi:hypothetical protein
MKTFRLLYAIAYPRMAEKAVMTGIGKPAESMPEAIADPKRVCRQRVGGFSKGFTITVVLCNRIISKSQNALLINRHSTS